jgi:hypothetical protein
MALYSLIGGYQHFRGICCLMASSSEMFITTQETTACHDTEDHNKTLNMTNITTGLLEQEQKMRPTQGLQRYSSRASFNKRTKP